MFRPTTRPRTRSAAALELAEVLYHTTVRSVRGGGANAVLDLLLSIIQTIAMIAVFYFLMNLTGMRTNGFRGDFVLFLITGVLSYITYKKTMSAVFGGGAATPMMLHSTMSTAIAMLAGAIGALYMQVLIALVILFGYHCVFAPVSLHKPFFAFAMLLQAWIFGIGTGLVLQAIRPWAPKFAPMLQMIIARVNVLASGKMFVANTLSFSMLYVFSWNPLFHIIDQMRGAVFVNYIPRNSSAIYPIWISLALIVIGLMGEFYTRQYVSRSWSART